MTDATERLLTIPAMTVSSAYEQQTQLIECPTIGKVNVVVQGSRSSNEVVILTVHDLGCNYTMYQDFVDHPKMVAIKSRTVWVHIDVPGQSSNAPDLPSDYQFPTMQQIGEDLVSILDQLRIKEVICFGEGAGANILIRFAMAHIDRVIGVCLIHNTATTAGFLESIKDKMMNWRLDTGMNPSAEQYLLLHRFGATKFTKASNKEELQTIVESYQDHLRNKINAKNLKKFVEAFLKRNSILEQIKKLSCPALLVTGQQSLFHNSTRQLHQALLKNCSDKTKIDFLEVTDVANVIEEKPDKLAESFQYFLQGCGLVSSVPMQNVPGGPKGRSMSMQDYDIPLRKRYASNPYAVSYLSASPRSNTSAIDESILSPDTKQILVSK